jgi:Undecaprenyl-phosphate glucose phosphotransferase
MLSRTSRSLMVFFAASDAVLGLLAFLIAYGVRFHTVVAALVPPTKGVPPLEQYLNIAPFVGLIVPFAYQIQGLYRLRRNRSRVDDFFAVLVGTILSVVLGIIGTLYFQTYYVSDELKARGAYEVSQLVWGLFLATNVALTYATRELVREAFERRWRAGIGLKRVLIAGAGDLGRTVADRIFEHRDLGYRVVGFVDDRASQDHLGYRGLPLLGTLGEVAEIVPRESIDVLYVALPLEEHMKMLSLLEGTSREILDVRVVPDLLQFIALRARLEDLDGLPVISLNEVPLQGFNTVLKRTVDIAFSAAALAILAVPMAVIAVLVKMTSPGPVLYRQERMGLDGKAFHVFKFRTMAVDAEEETGPVWAQEDDPRATGLGRFLRNWDLDEFPQFWNVLRGEMSVVGPRPERPFFVEQFRHRIPQYMLRHKVKAGLTGWAQVNGWRGNTSLEKRLEYDLYYIENWSLRLDLKIIWLTLIRGVHKHAYSSQ